MPTSSSRDRGRPVRARRALSVLAAVLPLVLGLAADVAWARGGGGGGYGGGGGNGGGGGGGDGGAFVQILVWLLVRHPYVGVPVLVITVVVMVAGSRKGRRAYQGSVIRRGGEALVGTQRQQALSTLLARDPAFDEARFLSRARTAFTKVQAAWCAHDLSPMRPFVSDGIHERFALQTKEQQELGYRDRMDDLEVLDAGLSQVESEGPFDLVTVAIRASAKDCRVRLSDGSKIRGTEVPEEFVEYWSFLRRAGRATKADASGLIEGQCPNCGAAIEMNQAANCAYCKAALRSGEFDWVLAEITQAVEWSDAPPAAVRGVEAMRAKDPAFSLQHLEDRASVMFWRWAMSQRQGTVRPLRKIASPAFCDAFLERSKASVAPDGTRRWVGERAVGAVEALGLATSGGRDRAVVEVRWQGTAFSAKPSGEPERGEKGTVSQTLFALERRDGARSDADASVSSAHCPNCGAPESGGESDACEHCGEVMNDGRRDWVLADVASRFAPEAREVLARLAEPATSAAGGPPAVVAAEAAVPAAGRPLRREAFAWLVRVTVADGEVDAKEREALSAVAEKVGLRPSDLDAMIATLSSPTADGAVTSCPSDAAEAREWLDLTAEVALADGRLSSEESRLLSDLGAAYGIPAAEVRLAVANARARLYHRAKSALRAS